MVSQWGRRESRDKNRDVDCIVANSAELNSSSPGESTAAVQRHDKEGSGMLCATEQGGGGTTDTVTSAPLRLNRPMALRLCGVSSKMDKCKVVRDKMDADRWTAEP